MDYGGGQSKTLKASTPADYNRQVSFTPPTSVSTPDGGSGSRPDSNTNLSGIEHGSAECSDSSDTVFSSESNSSYDDLFQVNPPVLPKFRVHNNIPKACAGSKNHKLDISSEDLWRLEKSIDKCREPTSKGSDITHEPLVPNISPLLSPPIQVMEKPGSFDTNRIPESSFSIPSTPVDWSAASNDSLFSIHIANGSFSWDHASRIYVANSGELPISGEHTSGELSEFRKSGELPKSGETYNSRESYQSGENFKANYVKNPAELVGFCQTSPTTKIEYKKIFGVAMTIGEDMYSRGTRMVYDPLNDAPKALTNNQGWTSLELSIDSSGATLPSDNSETSTKAFTQPVKKPSCSLCRCPDFHNALCCCKRSSWSCKCFTWPSCPRKCLSRKGSCCKISACSCKWFACPSCPKNCLSWKVSCCKRSAWSCKWSCRWVTWPSCPRNCLSWKGCCCKCPSRPSLAVHAHPGLAVSDRPSCTCPSWPSCMCPSWPNCTCQCSKCKWMCC